MSLPEQISPVTTGGYEFDTQRTRERSEFICAVLTEARDRLSQVNLDDYAQKEKVAQGLKQLLGSNPFFSGAEYRIAYFEAGSAQPVVRQVRLRGALVNGTIALTGSDANRGVDGPERRREIDILSIKNAAMIKDPRRARGLSS